MRLCVGRWWRGVWDVVCVCGGDAGGLKQARTRARASTFWWSLVLGAGATTRNTVALSALGCKMDGPSTAVSSSSSTAPLQHCGMESIQEPLGGTKHSTVFYISIFHLRQPSTLNHLSFSAPSFHSSRPPPQAPPPAVPDKTLPRPQEHL